MYYPCSENKGAEQLRGDFAVTAKLICVFIFTYAKIWVSYDAAHILVACMKARNNIYVLTNRKINKSSEIVLFPLVVVLLFCVKV